VGDHERPDTEVARRPGAGGVGAVAAAGGATESPAATTRTDVAVVAVAVVDVGEVTAAEVASERAANATPATVAETASPEATSFDVLTTRCGRELRRAVDMDTTVNNRRFGEDEGNLPNLLT
jgi:hypothetical protein